MAHFKRTFGNRAFALLLTGVGIVSLSNPSLAHTSSLGYVPGDTAGSVTFWAGSYEHGGSVFNEGTFTLQGITNPAFLAIVNANVAPTNTKPAGLVDGLNNFFWQENGSGGYNFPVSVDPIIFGLGISHWQGITFAGLSPGDYSFTCGNTCGSTQQWATLTNAAVTITLTGRDIGSGVPEPTTWATMLLGMGLIGFTMRRRRKQNTTLRYAF